MREKTGLIVPVAAGLLLAVGIFLACCAFAASPSGSTIPITDGQGNAWTVVGGVAQENGKPAGYSKGVTELAYVNGAIWQYNGALWWQWNGTAWVPTNGTAVSPLAASSSSSSSSSSSGGSSSSSSSSSSSGGSSSSSSSGGSTAFGIHVSGAGFVDQNGNPVQIVGTNISGLETGLPARWPSFANAGAFWTQFKSWNGKGFNTVRLPLNDANWLGYACGTDTAAYRADVAGAVAQATAAGVYVILDLHWSAPAGVCPIGQPGLASTEGIAFWASVANTFKGNPAVIFELFNEPFYDNDYNDAVGAEGISTMLNGGVLAPYLAQNNGNGNDNAIQTLAASAPAAGYQQMLDAVRSTGSTNVVLQAAPWWAGEIEYWLAEKATDPIGQLGVAWHVYGYSKGTAPPLAVLAAGYPIVITETYGLGAIGGLTWVEKEHIGVLGWGPNDWGNQALTTGILSSFSAF